jgi:hypothetical protein
MFNCKQFFSTLRNAFASLALIGAMAAAWQTTSAQTPAASPTPSPQTVADRNESERSDTLTGGNIEEAEFAADQPDIRLTLNLPSFRLTLWQNGKEVKSYYVGVGMKNTRSTLATARRAN